MEIRKKNQLKGATVAIIITLTVAIVATVLWLNTATISSAVGLHKPHIGGVAEASSYGSVAYAAYGANPPSVLRYRIRPYELSNVSLAGGFNPEDMASVRALVSDWKSFFGGGGPKLFFGFYNGYRFVLAVAGDAELVVRNSGGSTHSISLVMKDVALTYTKAGAYDASTMMKKFAVGKLLGTYKAPFKVLSRVLIYDEVSLTANVRVDANGYMYYNGVFMGTWPFRMPADRLILYVPPISYFLGSKSMASMFKETGTSCMAIPYAVEGPVAVPTSSRVVNASEVSVTLPTGRKLSVALLNVKGSSCIIADPEPFFPPFIMRYDAGTGVLKIVSLRNSAVHAAGGEVPEWYYSMMLPTPLFNVIGPNAQILMTPLGSNNAIEVVLEGS